MPGIVLLTGLPILLFAIATVLQGRYLRAAVDCDHASMVYPLFFDGEEKKRGQSGLFFSFALLYINWFAYRVFGKRIGYSARFFFILVHLVTGAALFLFTVEYFGLTAAYLTLAVFVFLMAFPQFEPHNDCSEKYFLLPITVAYFLLAGAALSGNGWQGIAALLLMAALPLFAKITDATNLLALPLFLAWSDLAWMLPYLAAGVGVIVLLGVLKRRSIVGLLNYSRAIRKISLTQFYRKLSVFLLPLLTKIFPLFFFFAYFALKSPLAGSLPHYAVLVWFCLAWMSVWAQARFFGYHLILIIPPLAIGSAIGMDLWFEGILSHGVPILVLGTAAVAWLVYSIVWLVASLLLTTDDAFHKLLWGRIGEYYYWEGAALRIGEYLRERTNADDYILQWGDTHQIYLYAQRRASTRLWCGKYVVDWHGLSWIQSFLGDILQRPPAYIVLMRKEIDVGLLAEFGFCYELEATLKWKEMEMPVYRLVRRTESAKGIDAMTPKDIERFFSYSAAAAPIVAIG